MPPVFRRLPARSSSTLACARFASATSSMAFARSRASRRSLSSRTAITAPCATRSPSSLRTRISRAATSATTGTCARGCSEPVSVSVSVRSRVSTVDVRTGIFCSVAIVASASVRPLQAAAPALMMSRNRKGALRVLCIYILRRGVQGAPTITTGSGESVSGSRPLTKLSEARALACKNSAWLRIFSACARDSCASRTSSGVAAPNL